MGIQGLFGIETIPITHNFLGKICAILTGSVHLVDFLVANTLEKIWQGLAVLRALASHPHVSNRAGFAREPGSGRHPSPLRKSPALSHLASTGSGLATGSHPSLTFCERLCHSSTQKPSLSVGLGATQPARALAPHRQVTSSCTLRDQNAALTCFLI